MKRSLKTFVALVLAVLIFPTLISTPAEAATRTVDCSLGGTFTIVGTSVTQSSANCAGEVSIPAEITEINSRAFEFRDGVTSVTFGANSKLTTIGTWAFQFTSIASIDLPDGLQYVGWWAFAGSKLTTLSVPGTVTYFGDDTFRSTTFKSLVFEPRIASSLFLGAVIFNATPNASVTFMGPVVVGPYDWNFYSWNKVGYTWKGWSTSADAPIVSFPLTVEAPGITLYQYRTPNAYPVHFNTNGGEAIPDGSFVTDGDVSSAPVDPIRPGYTLAGWSASYEGPQITFPYTPGGMGEITLYAEWTPNSYSVNYVSNGGSSVTSDTFVTNGAVPFPPTAPTRRGYVFEGWSAADNGPTISFPYTPNVIRDISLYAKWVPDHMVSFNPKGGSDVSVDSFSTGGQIDAAPDAPTRSGYTFLGWSATDGGDVISFPYTPGVTEDITLYAKWDANTYSVNLNTYGGQTLPPGSFRTGGEISEAPATPVRAGYTFHGWATTETGTVLSFPYEPGVIGDITLYATWTRDPYKPELSTPVTVSGTGTQSQLLTAFTGIWDAFPEAVVTLQWYRCDKPVADGLALLPKSANCLPIAGSTKSTYKVVVADALKYLTVLVKAKNSIGTALTTAKSLHALALKAPTKIKLPVISGTAVAKEYLTVDIGTWNSNPIAKTTIQWFRCQEGTVANALPAPAGSQCVAISGATKPRYMLGKDDEGKFVTAQITAANSEGTAFTTAKSVRVALTPSNISSPAISGFAQLGKVLTASSGSWLAFPGAKTSFKWFRCNNKTTAGTKQFGSSSRCVAIEAATKSRYTVTAADKGKYISVLVTAVNVAGTTTITAESKQVSFAPIKTSNPSVSGTAKVGGTLTATSGSWSAYPEAQAGFKWFRCNKPVSSVGASFDRGSGCVVISGATQSRYTVTEADQGKYISVLVQATNSAGSTSATSRSTRKVE